LLENLLNKKTYEFGEFRLDLDGKRLLRDGQTVSLQPKVFDMLVFFVENHGALVSRDELMKAIWKDTFVEESNLRFCLHALRKALGKNADGKDFVETIPKRGYRFIAQVSEESPENIPERIIPDDISSKKMSPEGTEKTRFVKRNWLIGISVFSLICLIVLAVAWQKGSFQSPEKLPENNTLAVLPFSPINENEGNLQTGLTDALITNLSKIRNLKVLPLTSVQKYTGQNFDTLAVGRELQAERILEGSYRFDGENVRVTINLLRVSDGGALWTETFTAKRKSNLELEQAIALRASRLFSLKFAQTDDEALLADKNLNPEAVQNYLAGRKIWQSRELRRHEEMIKHFEKAIELAPDWSLGFSGLAEALLIDDSYLTGWERIEQSTHKALELDAANANAHAAQAQIYFLKYWDWENAEKSFKKALELNSDYASAHNLYGVFLGIQRRFVEAENELRKSIEAEPFSPFYYTSLCELYYFDHRFDEALNACYYAQNLEPDFWRTRKNLFQIYVQKKMYAEMSEMVLGKLSEAQKTEHPLTKALAANDLRPFWENLINETLNSKNSARNSFALANFYLQVGEKKKALKYLEMALGQHEDYFPTANADPSFDSIRNEPQFAELMIKIGLRK
jgi:DNA-binding winged helix-turn-helix (wHTH) protein/TolB-like protein/Tfp pilus assembly protein PilF